MYLAQPNLVVHHQERGFYTTKFFHWLSFSEWPHNPRYAIQAIAR